MDDLTWWLTAGCDGRPWERISAKPGYRAYEKDAETDARSVRSGFDPTTHGPWHGATCPHGKAGGVAGSDAPAGDRGRRAQGLHVLYYCGHIGGRRSLGTSRRTKSPKRNLMASSSLSKISLKKTIMGAK